MCKRRRRSHKKRKSVKLFVPRIPRRSIQIAHYKSKRKSKRRIKRLKK